MNYTSYILAFQLCIILGSSSCYCQATFFKEIENLKEYFNASTSDVADGKPLFIDILKDWKEESDKKIIQSQIVSFYFKLFESLKDNQHIQKSMDTIKEDLFVKFFNSSSNKLNDFVKLTQIPVNDPQVQRKAISELIKVMNDLSPRSVLKKRKRSRCCFGAAEHPIKTRPSSIS
ncbi:interferon gamma [Castor canadensis]|uniref:Interferon gamma n=2 Tax=Castor canadensis TaxID=51338 RepID=A0A8B7TMP8_CASCN|nr:interferon gamma [Castor canadensis]